MKKFSANIHRDFGLDNADEDSAKAAAVAMIANGMDARGMSAADLARLSGIPAPNISEMLGLKLDRYSIERLNRVLAVFGKRVAVSYRLENVVAE
jgi:predicted XRE-type DNA-binding protein